jgi:nucleoside-diphosphate-sugar epimerase
VKILVTGHKGSVGQALVPVLEEQGHVVRGFDLPDSDIRKAYQVWEAVRFRPQWIIHLAASKSAPDGELDPLDIADTNVAGTANIVRAATVCGAKVLLASTCKAADPETAYGASKLLCERMVLAAGGSVARFFNVREAQGNVFRLWENIPAGEPLPVTPCRRFFISMAEAVSLLLLVMEMPAGRYTVHPGEPRLMRDVAESEYPGRELAFIPPRRGDRDEEPLCAASERPVVLTNGLLRITSAHDAG